MTPPDKTKSWKKKLTELSSQIPNEEGKEMKIDNSKARAVWRKHDIELSNNKTT